MTLRLLALALVVPGLAGCAAADQMVRDAVAAGTATGTAAGGTVQTTAASWSTDAREFRGRAGTFAFDCPPEPQEITRSVYGSSPYTDDSAVCAAGVHAGVISFARGGRVRVQMRPGQNRYVGSTRNRVQARDYGAWDGSYVVVQ